MEELSMAAAEKRTFSLPSEQAVYIDRLSPPALMQRAAKSSAPVCAPYRNATPPSSAGCARKWSQLPPPCKPIRIGPSRRKRLSTKSGRFMHGA